MESAEAIPQKRTDHPDLKELYRHVRIPIAPVWFNVGVELFEGNDVKRLNTIRCNHNGNAEACCADMLSMWHEKYPNTTWDDIIKALKTPGIDLNDTASTIERLLSIEQNLSSESFTPSIAKKRKTDAGIDGKNDYSFQDIDFATIDKVPNAFSKLFSVFQKATSALNDEEFQTIKNACITRADRADERLCNSLQQASDSQNLFRALAPYCNWMCIEYLETIAYAYKNDSLLHVIKNYSQVIFSKPLREVWNYVSFYSVKDKYYTELMAVFKDKDPDDLTVEELNKLKPQLAKEIAMCITVVRIESLLISWLFPTSKIYQAYLSFLTVPQQSRNDTFVKFGNWVAFLPQHVLKEQQRKFGISSTSTLLIGYYHGLLLRDTNADSLIGELYSIGLLSAQEQNMILFGHSSYHKNWLLLEHVRHMDSLALLAFSELVKNVWPQIGMQLVAALPSNDDDDSIIQEENNTNLISGVKFSYIETSSMLTVFFQISDSVVQLLSSCQVEVLLDACENLTASDKHAIRLFSDNQMKKLKICDRSLWLLQRLSLFFTWSNHSILRELAEQCFISEAVSILCDFDYGVDSSELIASYPIPCFSMSMIPFDSSSHTIVSIRCDQEMYDCSLQYVYDMQSVMMEKCDITQHCLQLLAVRSDPTILYWTIPKCVVYLINDNVSLNSEYLYSRGILEVSVYPDLVFKFDDHVSIGLLAFSDDSTLVEKKHADDHFQEYHKSISPLQETVECLKADKNIMEEKVEDLSAELQIKKIITSNQPLLYNKMADIKLENVQLNKENEQLKLELQEIKEKFDHLNDENIKLLSELKQMKEEKSVMKETLEDLSAELEVKKLKASNQPSLHEKIIDLKLENAHLKKQNEELTQAYSVDSHIKADTNQDTTLWTFHVNYVNGEVEEAFLNVSDSGGLRRGWLEINSVHSDGHFQGRIKPINETENVSAKLVVGNITRAKSDEETTLARENISVQHQLLVAEGEVDNSESVTLQAEKSSVPDDGAPKEKIVGCSHLLTDRSSNVTVLSAPIPQKQSPLLKRHSILAGIPQDTNEDLYSSSPESDIGMTPLSTVSSQIQTTAIRQHHSSIVPTVPGGSRKQLMLTKSIPEKQLNSTWIEMLHNVFHPTIPTCINEVQSTNSTIASCEDHLAIYSDKMLTKNINNFQHCDCPYEEFDLCKKCSSFWPYIEHHLKDTRCIKSVCTLWKWCLKKKQYSVYEFAPQGMIIFSDNKDKIGTITYDYENYRTKPEIGMGGYGRVFEHSVNRETSDRIVAVKEEERPHSLIKDLKRFTSILDLDHPNVLHFQEYVIGYHRNNDNKDSPELPLLLIMEHYDQRALNEPFKHEGQKCLLDYILFAQNDAKYIFRNLLVISLDLFNALDYFAQKGLVHRDVKRSNILLTLTCCCSSVIVCTCYHSGGRGGGTAILSDFDLVEKATSDGKWARLRDSEPAGTRGMKAPELFFVNENGEDTFTAKADIWSAFLTIMHVLLGRDVNDEPLKKITKFFQDATSGISDCLPKIKSHSKALQKYYDENKNISHVINRHTKVLETIQASITHLCRFQSGKQLPSKKITKGRDNYCPAAEMLTAIHGVSTMPQLCIDKVPHIFQSRNPLQESIKELWSIIQDGMCFRPEDRPNAKKVIDQLNDCLNKFLKSGLFS